MKSTQAGTATALAISTRLHSGYVWVISAAAALGGLLFGYDWVVRRCDHNTLSSLLVNYVKFTKAKLFPPVRRRLMARRYIFGRHCSYQFRLRLFGFGTI
jgi:hypothetical protein